MDLRRNLIELVTSAGRPLPEDWPGDRPLELDSLTVITLHDLIERTFEVRIRAAEILPESFADLDHLARLVEGKLERR